MQQHSHLSTTETKINFIADDYSTIAGSGAAGYQIQLTMPGTGEVLLSSVNANGQWSAQPQHLMPEGTHSDLSVITIDDQGNATHLSTMRIDIEANSTITDSQPVNDQVEPDTDTSTVASNDQVEPDSDTSTAASINDTENKLEQESVLSADNSTVNNNSEPEVSTRASVDGDVADTNSNATEAELLLDEVVDVIDDNPNALYAGEVKHPFSEAATSIEPITTDGDAPNLGLIKVSVNGFIEGEDSLHMNSDYALADGMKAITNSQTGNLLIAGADKADDLTALLANIEFSSQGETEGERDFSMNLFATNGKMYAEPLSSTVEVKAGDRPEAPTPIADTIEPAIINDSQAIGQDSQTAEDNTSHHELSNRQPQHQDNDDVTSTDTEATNTASSAENIIITSDQSVSQDTYPPIPSPSYNYQSDEEIAYPSGMINLDRLLSEDDGHAWQADEAWDTNEPLLDLSDLLIGSEQDIDSLSGLLSFSKVGDDTLIDIAGEDGGSQIRLKDVDLTQDGVLSSDADILQHLMDENQIVFG